MGIWLRFALVVACWLVFPVVAVSTDQPEAEVYIIAFQIVTTDRGWMESQAIDDAGSPPREIRRLTIGDLVVDLDAEHLWNGRPTPPDGSGVTVLSMPRVAVPADEKGTMRSGSTYGAQYLEWDGNGCYQAKTLPPELHPGLVIDVVPHGNRPSDQPGTVYLDLHLKVSTLGEREPVHGLDLDVGKPTVRIDEFDTHGRFRLDRWSLVTTQLSRDLTNRPDETLLVFVRASRR